MFNDLKRARETSPGLRGKSSQNGERVAVERIGGGLATKNCASRVSLMPSEVSWSGNEGNLSACLLVASISASQTEEGEREGR